MQRDPFIWLQGNEVVVPEGWPLTLGGSGLILHLGELEASALRLGECYLCVRSVAAATATATTSSVNGVKTAGKTAEQNTVEVSHVLFRSFSLPLLSSLFLVVAKGSCEWCPPSSVVAREWQLCLNDRVEEWNSWRSFEWSILGINIIPVIAYADYRHVMGRALLDVRLSLPLRQ